MAVKRLFGCLVLAVMCNLGYSCSCLPITIQRKYCEADFVMKVRVKSTLKNPNGRQDFYDFYKVQILGKPWKFENKKDVANFKRIYTASNEDLCGVYLQKGKRYLISGNVSRRKMVIYLCPSFAENGRLPRAIKKLKSSPPNCSVFPTLNYPKMVNPRCMKPYGYFMDLF